MLFDLMACHQSVSQDDIAKKLLGAKDQLREIWLDIQVIERDAPQDESTLSELKSLRITYRKLDFDCKKKTQSNKATSLSMEMIESNLEAIDVLNAAITNLRDDVTNTSQRIYRLGSASDESVVRNTRHSQHASQANSPATGLLDTFTIWKKISGFLKRERKDSKSTTSTMISEPRLDVSHALRPDGQHTSMSSPSPSAGAIPSGGNLAYQVRYGITTLTEQLVFTDERQGEVREPEWLGSALASIPPGLNMVPQLELGIHLASRLSRDTLDSQEYYDATGSLVGL